MLNNQDEGSIKGQGPAVMLPSRGSPFATRTRPAGTPEEAHPVGADSAPAMPEPHDLSPEDLAALFPSSHAEREAPQPTLGADLDLPGHSAAASTDVLAVPTTSPEDFAALFPSSPAERGAQVGAPDAIPPGARGMPEVPTTAPGMAIPSTTVVGGQALPGMRAFAAGLQLTEAVGITPTPYQRGELLAPNEELVKLFVPDGRLVTLWAEIDALEAQVTSKVRGLSLKGAQEMLDRLTKARNYLMNDRANYEEAEREVAEVRYRMTRIMGADALQQPRIILFYLFIILGLIVAGFRLTGPLSITLGGTIAGARIDLVWNTLLWGGIGGVTGALYALWVHVARDQDFDPQYAMWYYTNPLMGLILGAFAYVILRAGALTILSGAQAESAEISPFILYVLGWAVGFQQNLAFSLVNMLLKKLIPAEEKGQPAPVAAPPDTPAAGKK